MDRRARGEERESVSRKSANAMSLGDFRQYSKVFSRSSAALSDHCGHSESVLITKRSQVQVLVGPPRSKAGSRHARTGLFVDCLSMRRVVEYLVHRRSAVLDNRAELMTIDQLRHGRAPVPHEL